VGVADDETERGSVTVRSSAVLSLPRDEADALPESRLADLSERVLLLKDPFEVSMLTEDRDRRGEEREERRERFVPRGWARRMMKTGSEDWTSSGWATDISRERRRSLGSVGGGVR